MRRCFFAFLASVALAATLPLACSATDSPQLTSGGIGASGGASSSSSTSGGAAGDGGSSGVYDGGFSDAAPSQCTETGNYIYTLTIDQQLYKFDPLTLTFTLAAPIACQPAHVDAVPYSMAVDRDDHAFVVYTDGDLYQVDIETGACAPTAFVPGQSNFLAFGMGFSADSPGASDETLYVGRWAQGPLPGGKGLAKIDLQTLALTPIGLFSALPGRPELTGTGDGKLFGLFEGTPYVIAEIDKATGGILSQAPQAAIDYPPGSSNFAFSFWGGDFWVFAGSGGPTDVFRYKPSDATTMKVTSAPMTIIGAGVSTCAPTKTPG